MASKKQKLKDEREALEQMVRPKAGSMSAAKAQIRTAARAALIFVGVVWLLAFGFYSGLDSTIPLFVALVISAAVGIAALLIRRNLRKSEALGALLAGDELDPADKDAQLKALDARVGQGDAASILAKAQLQMQSDPRAALATLEKVDLEKAQKLLAMQTRAMRAMIHLNLGETKAARDLVDPIDLSKAPDVKMRANLAAVIGEAWARSGNPIEGQELLEKYDPEDKTLEELRMQLWRARAFAYAHRNDMPGIRRAMKKLSAISPQLLAMFLGQKRIHPLLQKEARRALEKSGFGPRTKIQVARR